MRRSDGSVHELWQQNERLCLSPPRSLKEKNGRDPLRRERVLLIPILHLPLGSKLGDSMSCSKYSLSAILQVIFIITDITRKYQTCLQEEMQSERVHVLQYHHDSYQGHLSPLFQDKIFFGSSLKQVFCVILTTPCINQSWKFPKNGHCRYGCTCTIDKENAEKAARSNLLLINRWRHSWFEHTR